MTFFTRRPDTDSHTHYTSHTEPSTDWDATRQNSIEDTSATGLGDGLPGGNDGNTSSGNQANNRNSSSNKSPDRHNRVSNRSRSGSKGGGKKKKMKRDGEKRAGSSKVHEE